jgi:hypothetical protein
MIYRGVPIEHVPDANETAESIQHRLNTLAANLVLDEAVLHYGTEKEKAA